MTREQFMARTEPGPNGCIHWTGNVLRGYGRVTKNGGANERAHRVAYKLFRGPIPDGLVLDHLCRNKRCVNPEHMEVVTIGENVLRGGSVPAQNARKANCVRGHPLVGGNLYTEMDRDGRTHRRCRTCRSKTSSERNKDPKNRDQRIAYFREYRRSRKEVV